MIAVDTSVAVARDARAARTYRQIAIPFQLLG